MSTQVKVGIAGLGRSGWSIHANILRNLPDRYQIVAVSDPDIERQREAKGEFDCNIYSTVDELLADPAVELFVVATPSHLHAQHAIQGLKAGKAVVCEKPMASTLTEADSMIETAQETRTLLTVFHNRRYAPDFLTVKEVVDSGKLGRILLIRMAWHKFSRRWDWQTLQALGGGTLNNTCPHAIDQALQLFGPTEPEIVCHLERALTLGDAEDHVKIILKPPNAPPSPPSPPLIDIEVSSACAYPQDPWLVMGTQGGLSGTFSRLRWRYFSAEELPQRALDTTPTPDRSYNRDEIPWREEEWSLDQDERPGQTGFYLDLYNTLRHASTLAITPASARRVMWVIERCHQLCSG